MFKYFLTITLRSLSRRGVFSIINILGLSIGLAVVLMISLLNFNERSFNRSFEESRNIFRINSYLTAFMPGETFMSTANATAPTMQEAIPEIIAAVRTYEESYVVQINDHQMRISVIWADEDFFRLFDTPFIHGSPEYVMSRPNAVVISESGAIRLFGNNNPVGETFSLDNRHLMTVTAVFRDFPTNSSFREHKMIAPFMYSYPTWFRDNIHWGNIDFETFCLLVANADTALVNAKMRQVFLDAIGEQRGFYYPVLQSLTDIHLHSSQFIGRTYLSAKSDISKVRMLTLMSIIVLLVACVNYMNLSTARAQKRSKEIGISKTTGAKRSALIARLTLETAIFTFISFALAWLLAWLLLPVFNDLLGEQLSFDLAFHPAFLGIAFLIWIAVTLLTATYPALYLSGFPPITAIRSMAVLPKSSHSVVRKILIVGQFTVAIVLIAWVMIIQTQIVFMNNKELGYNPRNLIGIILFGLPPNSNIEALANDFRAETSVEMVSLASAYLFRGNGHTIFKNENDEIGLGLTAFSADPNFIDLKQMNLIAGSTLPDYTTDSLVQIVLNRATVDYLGITPEEAIGKRVLAEIGAPIVEVRGVVENFHFESLHRPVLGIGFHNMSWRQKQVIMLRVQEGNLSEQLARYEEIFERHFPNEMFEVRFPEQDIARDYDNEKRTARIAIVLSILAIFIACLGVFGLTAFMAEQRTKEIGIRKVAGATVWNIVGLFTANYIKLLAISLLIAVPVAWYVGNQYLESFAFRISLSWWIFAVASIIVVAITLLTVSLQAIKAAMANPVKSLKTE